MYDSYNYINTVWDMHYKSLILVNELKPRFGIWRNETDALFYVKKPISVWKKIYLIDRGRYSDGHVIELILPIGAALVVHNYDSKCRTNIAYVKENQLGGQSSHDWDFVYKPGEVVIPRRYDKRQFWGQGIRRVCTSGIHCFMTKGKARTY